jgi:hypothetical protein
MNNVRFLPPRYSLAESRQALADWCLDADANMPMRIPDGKVMMSRKIRRLPGVTMGHLRSLAGLPPCDAPAHPRAPHGGGEAA